MSRIIHRLKKEYHWVEGNVLVLLITYFLSGFSSGLYYGFEPDYIEALGASALVIGLMNSVGSFIRALVRIPGAVITDRYGRRNLIILFTFIGASALLFYAFAVDWRIIFLGLLIHSFSRVYMPALSAIEADSIPEDKRGEGFSIIMLAPGLASGLSPPIAGYIIYRIGLIPGMRINYLVAFLCVLSIAILRYYWLEETLEQEPPQEGLWESTKSGIKDLFNAWKEVPRSLWTLITINLLKSSLSPLFSIYIILYVLDVIQINALEWGTIGSIYIILGGLFGLPLGKVIDKIGNWRGMFLSYLFSIPFLVLIIGAKGFLIVVGLFVIRTIGQLLWFPAIRAALAEMIPEQKRGRILGLSEIMNEAVTIVSSTLIALLYTIAPVYSFFFAIAIETLSMVLILYQIKNAGL